MTTKQRLVAGFLALWLGAVAVQMAGGFLARDGCLDRGGRYIADPDVCATSNDVELPTPTRPTAWWVTIALPGLLVGAVTYWVVARLLVRASRRAG